MSLLEIKNAIKQNPILYKILVLPYLPIRIVRNSNEKRKLRPILERNKEVLSSITEGNNIFYFGVPIHPNIGDMAQTFCTKFWLGKYFEGYRVYEFNTIALLNNEFLNLLKQRIKKTELIIVQSGYCSHQGHADHEMHKKVVSLFCDNPIVILPQTVNITNEKEWDRTRKAFESNKRLLFMTRDDISWNAIQGRFNCRIMNYPDIVTSLIGTRKPVSGRVGILLCLRNDGEKFYKDSEYDQLIEKLSGDGIIVNKTDTTIENIDSNDFYSGFSDILENTLQEYERYRVIITDRYHGTILANIANTPVVVLKTNDHKVTSGVTWFINNGYHNIYLANDIGEAYRLAVKLYNENAITENAATFREKYYDKLGDIIFSMMQE